MSDFWLYWRYVFAVMLLLLVLISPPLDGWERVGAPLGAAAAALVIVAAAMLATGM